MLAIVNLATLSVLGFSCIWTMVIRSFMFEAMLTMLAPAMFKICSHVNNANNVNSMLPELLCLKGDVGVVIIPAACS